MTLGQYIRKLRDEKDKSLREFAKEIDCSPAFVSDMELGRRYPSDEVLTRIARVLKVTVEELRAHDTRPLEEMRRLTDKNPQYALAFRRLIDQKLSPKDIIELTEKESKQGKKK